MVNITRREFLVVALGTLPSAALAGPLAAFWPDDARERPLDEPWIVERDMYSYLTDTRWEPSDWPTWRRYLNYDELSVHERGRLLIERFIGDVARVWRYNELRPPRGKLTAAHLAALEEEASLQLDDDVDPGFMSFSEIRAYGPYAVGDFVMNAVADDEALAAEFELTEGEHPGSTFSGVAFHGDLRALNTALARKGLNVTVVEA